MNRLAISIRLRLGVAVCASVAAASCASPVAPPVTTPSSDAAISWRLVSGTEGGSQDEVCRSDGAAACVVQASAPGSLRTAAFSLFLHAGALPVTYDGTVRVGFIGGETRDGYELHIDDYQVEPDADPVGVAATGLVTRAAGAYTVEITLDARPAAGSARSITRTVSVRVSGRSE
jgi:hypothetical protein